MHIKGIRKNPKFMKFSSCGFYKILVGFIKMMSISPQVLLCYLRSFFVGPDSRGLGAGSFQYAASRRSQDRTL